MKRELEQGSVTVDGPPTRVLRDHRRGCGAMRNVNDGYWKTPWTLKAHEPESFRGPLGGRGSSYNWIHFRCNDVHCLAEVIIREDAVRALLPSGGIA